VQDFSGRSDFLAAVAFIPVSLLLVVLVLSLLGAKAENKLAKRISKFVALCSAVGIGICAIVLIFVSLAPN